jgi:hypothetical protein
MKKNCVNVFVLFGVVLAMVLAACSQPSGGGGSGGSYNPPIDNSSGGGTGDLSMTIRNVRSGVTITHVKIEDDVSGGNPENLILVDEDVSIAPGGEKTYTNPGFRFEKDYDNYYGPYNSYTVHIETSPDIDGYDTIAGNTGLHKHEFPVILELRDNGLIRVGGSRD